MSALIIYRTQNQNFRCWLKKKNSVSVAFLTQRGNWITDFHNYFPHCLSHFNLLFPPIPPRYFPFLSLFPLSLSLSLSLSFSEFVEPKRWSRTQAILSSKQNSSLGLGFLQSQTPLKFSILKSSPSSPSDRSNFRKIWWWSPSETSIPYQTPSRSSALWFLVEIPVPVYYFSKFFHKFREKKKKKILGFLFFLGLWCEKLRWCEL